MSEPMRYTPLEISDLADRMEAWRRASFSISRDTAPLVIEALRHLSSSHLLNDLHFRVEAWGVGDSIQEVLAASSRIAIARVAFEAAMGEFPQARLTLRKGAQVLKANDPSDEKRG